MNARPCIAFICFFIKRICWSLIIPDDIYVIGGYIKGAAVNTLQSYDMTRQKWTTLQPMKEMRSSHAVCLQGDRIIVAGGRNGSEFLDTCEAFDTKSKRFVLPHPCRASDESLSNANSVNVNSHRITAGRSCRG